MSFIHVIDSQTKRMTRVNIDKITHYYGGEEVNLIWAGSDDCFCVIETPEEIDKLIEEAENNGFKFIPPESVDDAKIFDINAGRSEKIIENPMKLSNEMLKNIDHEKVIAEAERFERVNTAGRPKLG